MSRQDRNSHVSSERGLFQFNRVDSTLMIDPPLVRGQESAESLRAFFGAFMIHCMTLTYINRELYKLHNDMVRRTPWGEEIVPTQADEQRRQEILRHFQHPNGFLAL